MRSTCVRALWFALFAIGCDPVMTTDDDGGPDEPQVDGGLGESVEDGASCGDERICVDGACVDAGCGNNFVEDGEQCDDGNMDANDGCDPPSCTFTCSDTGDCADVEPCNGTESCSADHVCEATEPL